MTCRLIGSQCARAVLNVATYARHLRRIYVVPGIIAKATGQAYDTLHDIVTR